MSGILRSRSKKLSGTVAGQRVVNQRSYYNWNLIGSSSVTNTSGPFPAGQQDMIDYVSVGLPYYDHDLDLTYRKVIRQGLLNGVYTSPPQPPKTGVQYEATYTNWSNLIVGSVWNTGIPAIPSVDFPYWKNKALASVNPHKPVVDVPLFIFELREFPRMLKEMGDILRNYRSLDHFFSSHPSDLGKGMLIYQFGWAPLFSDLKSLDGLARAYQQRLRLLTDAKQGKKHRLTLSRSDDPNFKRRTLTLASVGSEDLLIEVQDRLKQKIWASLRFEPKDSDVRSLIDRLVRPAAPLGSGWSLHGLDLFGLRGLSAATLWNSYPWTWLIDYLVDVSTLLEITRGYVPFHVRDLNIMASQQIEETSTLLRNSTGLKYRPHHFEIGTKLRRTYRYPNPTFALSFLISPRRQWNLGALLTAKSRRALLTLP